MASLSSSFRVGNASASNLVKTAATVQRELATLQDTEAEYTYANSAKTSADLQTYTDYLNSRITSLQSSGTITDITKAQTMQQKVITATHENISADIVRENINLMSQGISGTPAGYQDKMNVVAAEYQRALGVGDSGLAQSLFSQYDSLSQSYQSAVTAASSAASTLSSAATSANVTYQGEVVTNLESALKSFTGTAKNLSENELNSTLAAWASANSKTMATLGVKINTSQPNYWDVVSGIAGAIYNAKVLQAQAESVTNPLVSATYAQDAQNYLTGTTKFSTLAGDLTVQQIAEAQTNPQMFAYDSSTGTYKMTIQTGYQYQTMTNADGTQTQQLVPSYSGMTQKGQFDKVYFLSPTETAQMTKLGLNFSENTSGTTGDGVQVQATENTPGWLKQLIGSNGIANVYSTQNGFLQIKAGSTSGQGVSSYVIAQDQKGLQGIYEQLPDGTSKLAGGDYGFSAGAVSLLINQAQQTQSNIAVENAKIQQQLVAQIKPVQQVASVAPPAPANTAPAIQPAAAPQLTFNPQAATNKGAQTLQPTANPQSTGGANLNQSGKGGIPLQATAVHGIPL